jgi:pyruvate formate lyase activating enzyme
MIFDIKEFAVHDGPGIRTTVFLKGCPLRCTWCHNPESQSQKPQLLVSPAGERVAGTEYTVEALSAILNAQADVLRAAEGGVTFSGGEPLLQAPFVARVIDRLPGLHVLLDTSGYGARADLERLATRSDLVYYDLKLVDPDAHRTYTGVDNGLILDNLYALSRLGVPFVIRVPLIPGVTDTEANLRGIAQMVCDLPSLIRVDLLPYNKAAGAKYRAAGIPFRPGFDENRALNVRTDLFESLGIQVRVRGAGSRNTQKRVHHSRPSQGDTEYGS